jgi:hypothetical protein
MRSTRDGQVIDKFAISDLRNLTMLHAFPSLPHLRARKVMLSPDNSFCYKAEGLTDSPGLRIYSF